MAALTIQVKRVMADLVEESGKQEVWLILKVSQNRAKTPIVRKGKRGHFSTRDF